MNTKIRWKPLLISVAIPLILGAAASLITNNAMETFEGLDQPPLSPPSWVFPVVWSILYILMGVAAYIVYVSEADRATKRRALAFYATQLFFNITWTIIFFNLSAFIFAFVWLVILWLLIVLSIVEFAGISKLSAYLLIPYLLWVSFAGYLNLAIALLNR